MSDDNDSKKHDKKRQDGREERRTTLLSTLTHDHDDDPKDPRQSGSKMPPVRSIVLYVLLAAVIVALVWGVVGNSNQEVIDELATSEFVSAVEDGRVHDATYRATRATVDGTYWRDEESVGDEGALVKYSSTYIGEDALAELMAAHPDVTYSADVTTSSRWISVLGSVLPMLIIVGFMLYMFNKFQDPNSGAMQFGKTKAMTDAASRPKVKFSDVAGCDEAIEELKEIKEFLEDPKKFQQLGAKIPRGVLLVGPPGTGKTLLAKAVAGEAGVPFFSISGSGFVEMFVGVGASRVRDLFSKAKEAAPSIVFIDEIDAVGRQRGAGVGGGHDEREQTLNQLLVEMDGFEEHESVILIAATNRPDVLDPALLRPGRFDRQVVVATPDLRGRKRILEVHTKRTPLAPDVDLEVLARGTPGFSGADLENLVNEAALQAAKLNQEKLDMRDFEYAKDKVLMGRERRSLMLSDEEKRNTAYHEGGHALAARLLPGSDPVHKVTIIPRGRALGVTMQLPEEDRHSYTRGYLLNTLVVLLGGRVAEELVLSDYTTGASNDIERVTRTARRMVCEWGMSEAIGTLAVGEKNEEVFIGREWVQNKNYSEETARLVDAEVKRIVEEAYARCRKLLQDNMETLHRIANALLERETITGEELDLIMENKPLPPLDANGKPVRQENQQTATGFVLEPDTAADGDASDKEADTPASGKDSGGHDDSRRD